MKVSFLVLCVGVVMTSDAVAATSTETVSIPSASRPSASAPTLTAETTATTARPIGDKFSASYFGTWRGASLSDPGSRYTLDSQGMPQKRSRTNLDGDINAAYLFTKTAGVGPYIPFLIVPSEGQHFILADVGIKAFNKKTVDGRGFSLNTNLILQAPTSQGSIDRHMKYAVKTTPSIRFVVPHSNFSVGSWTEAKAYVGVDQKARSFKLWAGPYVNYSLRENLSLNVMYEIEAHHYAGRPTTDFMLYQHDLQPGVVWNITRSIMVNPFVQIFTGNRISFANSAFGTVVSASLL